MIKRMLIDATHAEETRVVVLDGNRIEDYDLESADKKQLKGNVYLAKVVRVEPSLQAAFVEYGGNRHGFLAFDEIHPDYYQIPIADRQKLLAMQEADERAAQAAEEDEASRQGQADAAPATDGATIGADAAEGAVPPELDAPDAAPREISANGLESDEEAPEGPPETLGGEAEADSAEELHPARIARHFLRQYKIQEVIHRRQIVLVQVVKEERGAKGAALTTYISLAGRYCVLMPNSPRGGGVSRKITALSDRKRLKEVMNELAIPAGMGLIVRTAGANRPKPEIRRDCEYLLRLWDEIRDAVMKSVAPALIYEEASLIKRAIRDVYSRDIEEVLVDGEPGWQAAREFMRTLMPTHARKVVLWENGGQSLFAHEHVEAELDDTLSPVVPLRSGGSLVINQAEALVAIDVNSGRATRERNIEETALRTNLEAADEVGRQLRLRDLAGLIVIDFIDMEARKHNAMVERRLKEALKGDRARVQVGRISHFGLLEMSRQRLHPSLNETSFSPCPHCGGTGHVRSVESSAVHLLRALEDEASRKGAGELVVHAAGEVALYILNHKRAWLAEIEAHHSISVSFAADAGQPVSLVTIERSRTQAGTAPARGVVRAPTGPAPAAELTEAGAPTLAEPDATEQGLATAPDGDVPEETSGEDHEHHRRRRRRRRRRDEPAGAAQAQAAVPPPEFADQPEVREPALPGGDGAEPEQPAAARQPAGRSPTRDPGGRRPPRQPRRAGRAPRPPRRTSGASMPVSSGEAEPSGAAVGLAPAAPLTAAQPFAAPSPATEVPLPAAPGPTPANPFVDPTVALFDALEISAGTAEARPSPAEARDAAEPPFPATEAAAPTPAEPAAEQPPVDDRPPEPAVRPVLVGAEPEDHPAKKKRGWWHA